MNLKKFQGNNMGEQIRVQKVQLDTDRDRLQFIYDTLENCQFDLTYHDKLKMPLTALEQQYFNQASARINGAKELLQYFNQKYHQLHIELAESKKREGIFSKLIRYFK